MDHDRRSDATMHRLPRRRLGRGTTFLLVLLRLYVAIAIPIVCYAFIHALHASGR